MNKELFRAWLNQEVGTLSESALDMLVTIADLYRNPAAREALQRILPRLDGMTWEEFTAAVEAAKGAAAEA